MSNLDMLSLRNSHKRRGILIKSCGEKDVLTINSFSDLLIHVELAKNV